MLAYNSTVKQAEARLRASSASSDESNVHSSPEPLMSTSRPALSKRLYMDEDSDEGSLDAPSAVVLAPKQPMQPLGANIGASHGPSEPGMIPKYDSTSMPGVGEFTPLLRGSRPMPYNGRTADRDKLEASNSTSAAVQLNAMITPPTRRKTADPVVEELGSRAKAWWPTMSSGGVPSSMKPLSGAVDGSVIVSRAPLGPSILQQQAVRPSAVREPSPVPPPWASTDGGTPLSQLGVRHPYSTTKRNRPEVALGSTKTSIIIDSDESDSPGRPMKKLPQGGSHTSGEVSRQPGSPGSSVRRAEDGSQRGSVRPRHPSSIARHATGSTARRGGSRGLRPHAMPSLSASQSHPRSTATVSVAADCSSASSRSDLSDLSGGSSPERGPHFGGSLVSPMGRPPPSSQPSSDFRRSPGSEGSSPSSQGHVTDSDSDDGRYASASEVSEGSSHPLSPPLLQRQQQQQQQQGTVRRQLQQQFKTPVTAVGTPPSTAPGGRGNGNRAVNTSRSTRHDSSGGGSSSGEMTY